MGGNPPVLTNEPPPDAEAPLDRAPQFRFRWDLQAPGRKYLTEILHPLVLPQLPQASPCRVRQDRPIAGAIEKERSCEPATNGRVEHPLGNLQHWESAIIIQRAGKALQPTACANAPHGDLPALPRVPAIAHFSSLSFMGVKALGCTMRAALTHVPPAEFAAWDGASPVPGRFKKAGILTP